MLCESHPLENISTIGYNVNRIIETIGGALWMDIGWLGMHRINRAFSNAVLIISVRFGEYMGWNTSDVHGQFLEILLSLSIPIISEKRNSKARVDND